MTDHDLKPCPNMKCRSVHTSIEATPLPPYWCVRCLKCKMTGPISESPALAIETWNKWLPRQHLQLVTDDTKAY